MKLSSFLPRLASLSTLLFATHVAVAQNNLKEIPKPDPVAELAAMQLDPAVSGNLFAADPQITKPIHMNFGADGRLWVATSAAYPQITPGEKANDKIIVLEDTDGDGKADKDTVFAEGLLIPTGVLPDLYDSKKGTGVYVAASTQLLYFLDTDNDGKADVRKVILTGFGTEDTHHLLHTLRWGPDGCLYMNQSIYIHSHVETPYGTKRLDGGGIWRYNPRTQQLDVVCKGFVNPWGHIFDAYGQSFATDGAYGEGINHVFPGSVFVTSPGATRWLSGMNPGSPKHCGLEMLSGSGIPDSTQGHLITSDFRSHRVNRFAVTKTDAGYRSQAQPDLIKSSHVAFRPIDAKMGPDGCLYIADWYNPIIQHGEVDFRDDRRDRTHGRIWRIKWADGSSQKQSEQSFANLDLEKSPVALLLSVLASNNEADKTWARIAIAKRLNDSVMAELDSWVGKANGPKEQSLRQLQSAWVYAAADKLKPTHLQSILSSEVPEVKAAAIRLLINYFSTDKATIETLATTIKDPDWLVRLETLSALRSIEDPQAVLIGLEAAKQTVTPEIDFALWTLLREKEAQWVPLFVKQLDNEKDAGTNWAGWIAAIRSAQTNEWLPSLLKVVKSNKVPADVANDVVASIATRANPDQAGELLGFIANEFAANVKDNAKASQLTSQLEKLVAGTAGAKVVPKNAETVLRTLSEQLVQRSQANAESTDPVVKLSLAERQIIAKASGQWGVGAMQNWLIDQLTMENEIPADRANEYLTTILESLGAAGGGKAIELLETIATEKNRKSIVREAAITAASKFDLKQAAKWCIASLSKADADNSSGFAIQTIANRKGGPEALIEAINVWNKDGKYTVAPSSARAAIQSLQSAGVNNDALRVAIQSAGDLSANAWKYSPELLAQVTDLLSKTADAKRGELIYRRSSLQCMRCHAIGSGGGNIGPNLVSLGGSSQVDYILQSLIEPDAKLKEGFQTAVVLTDDETVVTGLVKSRTDKELQLTTAEGKIVTIPVMSIENEKIGKSLMPANLVDPLSITELADLTAFLSNLGRNPDFTVSTEPWIRNWDALQYTDAGHTRLNRTSVSTISTDDSDLSWIPTTSFVNGKLPISDLSGMQPHREVDPFAAIRVSIDCQQAGPVLLKLSTEDLTGIQVWIDAQAWPNPTKEPVNLAVGKHRISVAITKKLHSELGIQMVPAQGGAAIVQPSVAIHGSLQRGDGARKSTANHQNSRRPFRLVSALVEQAPADQSTLFQNGDRVAILGGRLWEQLPEQSDLETRLTIRLANRGIIFRNVAWSGDCVEGRARAVFGNTEDGYKRRLVDLKAAAPTLVLVAYGQNEAIDKSWSTERFQKGLERLLNDLETEHYRIALVTPTQVPSKTSFPADLNLANSRIQQFTEVILQVAKTRGVPVLQLPSITSEMTEDGLAVSDLGYKLLGQSWANAIALPATDASQTPISIQCLIKVASAPSSLDGPKQLELNEVRFINGQNWSLVPSKVDVEKVEGKTLPVLAQWTESYSRVPEPQYNAINQTAKPVSIPWKIEGLPQGSYTLTRDGEVVASASADQWQSGIAMDRLGGNVQYEKLRAKIAQKEETFFHRYRPQNETYLLLFRKHEQGRNAVDMDRLAELAANLDKEIAELVKPTKHIWQLQVKSN